MSTLPRSFPNALRVNLFDEMVYYGVFPKSEDDGDSALIYTPPDDDGVVGPQPV